MKHAEKVNKALHNRAIKAAIPHTLPVMAGYLFLGASYGILMSTRGFSFIYPMITSSFIFAGSLEFALAGILIGAFNPLEALLLSLMINARHIFYGISMLDKYRGLGKKKLYLIYALTDETFSVNYSAEIPDGVERGLFYFYTSLFDHLYWVLGATVGGIFGSLLPSGIAGLDFAMTAMFTVILLEQLLSSRENIPSVVIGVSLSLLSLVIFGSDGFIIPSMLLMLLALVVFRRPIERIGGEEGAV
jgi:4-azaleucine resistance transporter AzlC